MSDIKLGISPIGWSNDDLLELGGDTPLETFLKEAREIGFSGVELGNKFPKDKKDLKAVLQEYDLELAGGWFSGNLLVNSLMEEQEILAREIERRLYNNCTNIVYAECSNTIQGKSIPLSQKPILDIDSMKRYAESYSKLHEFAKKEGVTLAYHHHMGAIIQTSFEVDSFLQYASNEAGLTFDSGHFAFSGADPVYELEKHIGRVYHVHFKDIREQVLKECLSEDFPFLDSVLKGVYTTPGDGVLDFKSITEILKKENYKGWIIIEAEQDPRVANPYEYSKRAFSYITDFLKDC